MISEAPYSMHELQWFILIFFGSVIIYFLKKKDKSTDDHEKALRENTFALIKLSLQMELVLKDLAKLPELEKDLNNLGLKVRSLENGNANHQS